MRGGGRWNRKERNGSQGRMGLAGEIQSGCTAGSRHHSRFAQALKASKTRSRIAREIGGFELRERLRKLRWAKLKASLVPGMQGARALEVLADRSAFFDPPANGLPATPAPDR
jgi:hypothetical protein